MQGYVLTGEMRRWCYNDGDWNWAENGDAACVGEEEEEEEAERSILLVGHIFDPGTMLST